MPAVASPVLEVTEHTGVVELSYNDICVIITCVVVVVSFLCSGELASSAVVV